VESDISIWANGDFSIWRLHCDPRSARIIKHYGIYFDEAGVIALQKGSSALRDLIDLRDLLRAQRPADRLHVLLDLLDAGRAGDDARYLRARGEP
jgi:hypothetical protein